MLNRYYPAVDDPISAWKNHVNNQASLDDIKLTLIKHHSESTKQSQELRETINEAKRDYLDSISEMSIDISNSIDYCSSNICGSLDQGFGLIGDDIQELGRSLDIRLSLIMEQEIINNLLSENIALLLRIPEIQKERQYYLEQGIKHLKNAFIEKDFYENALENLLEAEKREKTDYISLHHIGMIYLYSSKYLDLSKAEDYFRRAGKFAKIESDPNAFKLANIMTGSVLTKLADNVSDIHKMRYLAAESYLQGAIACYIQKKYNEAAELGQIAFDLAPEMLEAGFYACLSNALAGKNESTIKLLGTLVDRNSTYAFIAGTDPILATKDYIKDWLAELKQNTIKRGLSIVENIKTNIIENSKFYSDLNAAQSKLNDANYLDALSIISYLNCELPISEEKEVFNHNLDNIESLRKGIVMHNRNVSVLNNSPFSIHDLEVIDETEITKYDFLNSTNKICDQWLLSEEIFFLSTNKIIKTVHNNLTKLYLIQSNFKKAMSDITKNKNTSADEMENNNTGVIVSSVVIYCIVFLIISNSDFEDKFIFPTICLSGIIGGLIIYAIIRFKKFKAKEYRKESIEEIELNNSVIYLNKNISDLDRLLTILSRIEIFQSPPRYIPFNVYFERNNK